MTTVTDRRRKDGKYRRWIEIDPKQAPVWRYAWDLLLTGEFSESDICDALHAKGYTLNKGTPFVYIKNGRKVRNKSAVSKVFHNSFYAGLIYLPLENGEIVEIQGEWEPIVTPQEFEAGVVILNKRDGQRNHHRRNDYLLSGLITLEYPDGSQKRLTCETPNKNRARGGSAPHYCDKNHPPYFLCRNVDPQVVSHLHHIQIRPDLIPEIKHQFEREISDRLRPTEGNERQEMESRLKKLDQQEKFLVRQALADIITEPLFQNQMAEINEHRRQIEAALAVQSHDVRHYVDNLEAALELLSRVGTLYECLDFQNQRKLLRGLANHVIITEQGTLARIELNPPFSYIQSRLGGGDSGLSGQNEACFWDEKTIEGAASAPNGSNRVEFCGPSRIRTCNQSVMSRLLCR